MGIGCKIITKISRADKTLVEKFRNMPTPNIDDNMGRIGAVDQSIKPINGGFLLGTAFTIRVPQGDNLMFHAAMDMAQKGDVILIDAGGSVERAIFGELMATYCKTRGVAGIVCDGAIRDADGLANLKDFPIYAKGITPDGPYKNGPGEINVPIVIGGKTVNPGDIIVGDADGIIIISPDIAEELAKRTHAVNENEEQTMKNILEKGTFERPWLQDKLKEVGCEII